ncbi:MAG TPA: hypothetical protein VHS52_09950 [Acidimicrobiales bacterium]|jgi:hypothetical protein|nr:hypothetical protein [Acidimicrobiales bacterium]
MQDRRGASSGGSEPTDIRELADENDQLRARLDQVEPRIAELERLLEEVHRGAKHQSAPFSKGKPKDERQTPGRKKGSAHGLHGYRGRPTRSRPNRWCAAARVLPGLRGGERLRAVGQANQATVHTDYPSGQGAAFEPAGFSRRATFGPRAADGTLTLTDTNANGNSATTALNAGNSVLWSTDAAGRAICGLF